MVAQQGAVNAIPTDSGSISSADYPLPASLHQTLISCPFSAGGDDRLSRGFYVQSYPGTNLGTVQVTYWTGVAGSYSVSMTARDGTYDGPMIGTTRIVTVDLPASTYITATFDFGGASVIPGTTVTFSQAKVSGPGSAYYNTGPCGLDLDCTTCSGVYQTWGTAPPLDTIRRRSVAVTIAQIPPYYWSYLPLAMR
jgi:hypothetical protein